VPSPDRLSNIRFFSRDSAAGTRSSSHEFASHARQVTSWPLRAEINYPTPMAFPRPSSRIRPLSSGGPRDRKLIVTGRALVRIHPSHLYSTSKSDEH
jgi:hypothetical protein